MDNWQPGIQPPNHLCLTTLPLDMKPGMHINTGEDSDAQRAQYTATSIFEVVSCLNYR